MFQSFVGIYDIGLNIVLCRLLYCVVLYCIVLYCIEFDIRSFDFVVQLPLSIIHEQAHQPRYTLDIVNMMLII